ncbi:hypothetical protein [Paraliobacillus sediminis]|uniref:hypothetical protein n=1 Tax=Paraliobacillus sediminis TaxID=1885916 RepID=UPI000E3B9452|nr:hypothetical protein [Paraliobacillus sediminis]
MQLLIKGKSVEFKNDFSAIHDILSYIENEVKLSEKNFSHLVINGEEVYEQFEDKLRDNVDDLKKVEVVLLSLKELLNETYLSGETYLTNALPAIKSTIDLFYQGASKEPLSKLQQILDALEWIDQLVNSIDQSKQRPANWEDYLVAITTIRTELASLEDALKSNDPILIADILNYEIFPALEALKNAFTVSIDNEGERKDVN